MNASKSKKNTAHVPSASKAYTRNLSFCQTCISGQQGYTMLWLWLLLEGRRNHTRSAWWPCANYKTSPTILQGRSATNITRYFKCVLPRQPILHQGDISFLRAKFTPNTSPSPTISSPRTQTDDRTKACCKVLVGLWSVTILSPDHVPTIWKHQTLKTKTFLLLLTTLNCRIWDCYFTILYDTDYNDTKLDYESSL